MLLSLPQRVRFSLLYYLSHSAPVISPSFEPSHRGIDPSRLPCHSVRLPYFMTTLCFLTFPFSRLAFPDSLCPCLPSSLSAWLLTYFLVVQTHFSDGLILSRSIWPSDPFPSWVFPPSWLPLNVLFVLIISVPLVAPQTPCQIHLPCHFWMSQFLRPISAELCGNRIDICDSGGLPTH